MDIDEKGLALLWLRDKAENLRMSASRMGSAYTTGLYEEALAYTSKAYRKAAVVLDEAADAIEDGEVA